MADLKDYGMKVLWLPSGKEINWQNPPDLNHMVGWSKGTTGGHPIKGSMWTICHLDHLNRLAYRRWGVGIQVIQSDWNTGVPASAGTHDFDSCWDIYIPGVDYWTVNRFIRMNGGYGWVRQPPLFGWHYHFFTLPPVRKIPVAERFKAAGLKVGVYVDGGFSTYGRRVATAQIDDAYNRAFGLANQHNPNSDTSFFPKKGLDAKVFDLKQFINARAKEQAA